MTESYGALCSDFYVNQRLNLKMDLPSNRETVLAMFDRVRREFPSMNRFRRYSNELALESDGPGDMSERNGGGGSGDEEHEGAIGAGGEHHQWLALRRTSIRTGAVNPENTTNAYKLHRAVLETAPYFLSISPLDVDYLELLYGFDLLAGGNHDAIVFDALVSGSPLAALASVQGALPIDCQPLFGLALSESADLQAYFEVKTRTPGRPARGGGEGPQEPISIYLTLRKYGSVNDVSELMGVFDTLSKRGEELLEHRVVPSLLLPIREAIASSNS